MKRQLSETGLRWLLPLALVLMVLGSARTFAQEEAAPAAAEEVVVVAEEAAGPAYYEKAETDYVINTLIMFICAVLVLFMQAGFAMVEVGLNAS